MQREREAEGEEFADKESFVTASYLKKMEELKKAEEDAKLQEMKEGKEYKRQFWSASSSNGLHSLVSDTGWNKRKMISHICHLMIM